MSREVNPRKAAVIGCGFVGSATAFTLMQSRLFSELVLLDVNMEKADGEAKDIAHGIPFAGQMKIYAGTYDDAADAAIIIITAGANQKPGETRLDLVQKNTAIYQSIIPEIVKRDFGGILLIVSNPVDILTYVALKLSGCRRNGCLVRGRCLTRRGSNTRWANTWAWTAGVCILLLSASTGTARSRRGAVRMYRAFR